MKTFIFIGITGLLLCSCTNEAEIEPIPASNMPVSGTVSISEMTRSGESVPPVGDYWLYYDKNRGDNVPLACEVKTGKDSLFFKGSTVPVWGWVQNASPAENTAFQLTNVAANTLPSSTDSNYDVLWGETKGWAVPLNFILSHRMSMLTIRLETSDQTNQAVDFSTVTNCNLDNIATNIKTFTSKTGVVEAGEQSQMITFKRKEGETGKTYTTQPVILPPQKRNESSKVTIIVNGKTFASTLPEGMTLVTDQYSRLFEFLQGYHLTITAKLFEEGASNRIMFTAATLTPWIYDGSGTIGAKIGGIYNTTDLTSWISAYNTAYTNKFDKITEADSINLLKYGHWDNETRMWIFSLYKEIEATTPSVTIAAFNDSIFSNGYKIKGITQEDQLFTLVNKDNTNEKGYGSVRVDSRIYDTTINP